MPDGSNLPRSPRYLVVLPVVYQVKTGAAPAKGEGSGWTRNLSQTGGCLELTEALAPGTPIDLVLRDEGGGLALDSEVVWVGHPRLPSGGTLHGVAFPQPAAGQRQALQALLRRKGRLRPRPARIPAALPARCGSVGASGEALQGWTGDISPGGCLLLLPDRLPVGTLTEVTLTTPRGDLTAMATVVWVESSTRVLTRQLTRHGVRFLEAMEVREKLFGVILEGMPTGAGREP